MMKRALFLTVCLVCLFSPFVLFGQTPPPPPPPSARAATAMNAGLQHLKDSNWAAATQSFESVLTAVPTYAPAYMGMLCAQLRVTEEKLLADLTVSIDERFFYKAALEHADPAYKEQIQRYASAINSSAPKQEHPAGECMVLVLKIKPVIEIREVLSATNPATVIPEEVREEAREHVRKIREVVNDVAYEVEHAFRWCPAGTFMMGSPKEEEHRQHNEPHHEVKLSRGFWMLETEVTQMMWASVMGTNPSRFKGINLQESIPLRKGSNLPKGTKLPEALEGMNRPTSIQGINLLVTISGINIPAENRGMNRPVEQVSWDDCQDYIKRLNDMRCAPPGFKFSLPTEAQWEYACRAGTTTAYHFGNTLNQRQANYGGNGVRNVGSYPANAWGLRDMHGNVWEWCLDWYDRDAVVPDGAVTDPVNINMERGLNRVLRGGTWQFRAIDCRSAHREFSNQAEGDSGTGFRLVLVPESQ